VGCRSQRHPYQLEGRHSDSLILGNHQELAASEGMGSARRIHTVIRYGLGHCFVKVQPKTRCTFVHLCTFFQSLNSDKLKLTPLRGPQKKDRKPHHGNLLKVHHIPVHRISLRSWCCLHLSRRIWFDVLEYTFISRCNANLHLFRDTGKGKTVKKV
jgi:hypothetical protein